VALGSSQQQKKKNKTQKKKKKKKKNLSPERWEEARERGHPGSEKEKGFWESRSTPAATGIMIQTEMTLEVSL
jgi:hypothetical protein